ncbi:hypothetical protein [Streptomyces griseorubiginosus]|uniref:hypothetical protein n=1 Tax=Streptomyces griseorubiginosus TaxID=67304 RepID=UPI001AD67932|nr:hypothetical protein [Streptomyces griseorubiginosus]MBO4254549.1 hypothetical protein [Streptomyces griseorubiginosus]
MSSPFAREVALYTTVLVGRAEGASTPSTPVADIARDLVMLEDGYGVHIVSRKTGCGP